MQKKGRNAKKSRNANKKVKRQQKCFKFEKYINAKLMILLIQKKGDHHILKKAYKKGSNAKKAHVVHVPETVVHRKYYAEKIKTYIENISKVNDIRGISYRHFCMNNMAN